MYCYIFNRGWEDRVSLCSPPYTAVNPVVHLWDTLAAAENYGIILTLASCLTTCFSHLQRRRWNSGFESYDPRWTNYPKICLNRFLLHNILWFRIPQLNCWFCGKKTKTNTTFKKCFIFLSSWLKSLKAIMWFFYMQKLWVITHYLHGSHYIVVGEILLPSHWVFSKVIPIT